MTKKKALITGITGQDGSYLAEFLLEKGYEVYGLVRVGELISPGDKKSLYRIQHLIKKLILHECDLTNAAAVQDLIKNVMPHELYHLASQVEPRILFEEEVNIFKVNFESTHHILQALKKINPQCKFFLAGSSMIFGNTEISPQDERTPVNPTTPYGIAKAAAFFLVKMYREAYGIFGCTGILFNHESPRRDPYFLPRKITLAATRIKAGLEKELRLGNLDARRDWGFAGDFVEAMHLMLQQNKPDDYVIGTGVMHSVRELVEIAFNQVGLDWKDYVVVDKGLFRPLEAHVIVADIKKIHSTLGWFPKTDFQSLVAMMVEADTRLV